MRSETFHVATLPSGSLIERTDEGRFLAFLPDGSAKMFTMVFSAAGPPTVDTVDLAPLKLTPRR